MQLPDKEELFSVKYGMCFSQGNNILGIKSNHVSCSVFANTYVLCALANEINAHIKWKYAVEFNRMQSAYIQICQFNWDVNEAANY